MTIGRAALAVTMGLFAAGAPVGPGGLGGAPALAAFDTAGFARFLDEVRRDAVAAGIARETVEAALSGVTFDAKVAATTTKQSEFVRPISDYVSGAASANRIAKGRQMAERWSSILDQAQSRYGVPREIVLAVWGMESGFGGDTGKLSVVRSLATLAFIGHRGTFFRDELIAALRILDAGDVEEDRLLGSWAGAMGQTQFMPSSYLTYAVDADGDGRRDIWRSVPDALASTAKYLREKGWKPGLPWGVEVVVPPNLDLRENRRPLAQWASLGVTRADGEAMPRGAEAQLWFPMGRRGPALLLTENFDAIRAYNSSDAYALGVGHLGDRIRGEDGFSRSWPTGPTLDAAERKEVQKRLAGLNLYSGEADGRHGGKTREAIRAFQAKRGMPADGYADAAVLKALRAP